MSGDGYGVQERKLTGDELVERTLKLLGRHARPSLPLARSAVRRMQVNELRKLDRFLRNPTSKRGRKKRPYEIPSSGKPRYPYLKGMTDYIENHWGFRFECLSLLSVSLLEAAANYLARIYTPFGDAFAYSRKGILVMCSSGTEKIDLVKKFLAEEPKRAKLIADNNKSFVFAAGENRSVVFNEDQFDSLEKRAGTPLRLVLHLDRYMGAYEVEDVPYEDAMQNMKFNVPERVANSMRKVRFVKSGMVEPLIREEYPKELHEFYLHMRDIILDRVA